MLYAAVLACVAAVCWTLVSKDWYICIPILLAQTWFFFFYGTDLIGSVLVYLDLFGIIEDTRLFIILIRVALELYASSLFYSMAFFLIIVINPNNKLEKQRYIYHHNHMDKVHFANCNSKMDRQHFKLLVKVHYSPSVQKSNGRRFSSHFLWVL